MHILSHTFSIPVTLVVTISTGTLLYLSIGYKDCYSGSGVLTRHIVLAVINKVQDELVKEVS